MGQHEGTSLKIDTGKGPQRIAGITELAVFPAAKGRIIADSEEVIRRAPDIIIGSWCGKRFSPQQMCDRPGWETIPAVRNSHLHEIKSCDILQPSPAALTDGVRQLHAIVQRWAERQ